MDNNYYNNNINNVNTNASDYMLWLILGIVQICTVCCCNCFTFVFGILTVIFAVIANTNYKNGNIIEYQSKIKLAKILNIIGWVSIILNIIVNLIIGLFDIIMEMIKGM